jgi:hypothetical protein
MVQSLTMYGTRTRLTRAAGCTGSAVHALAYETAHIISVQRQCHGLRPVLATPSLPIAQRRSHDLHTSQGQQSAAQATASQRRRRHRPVSDRAHVINGTHDGGRRNASATTATSTASSTRAALTGSRGHVLGLHYINGSGTVTAYTALSRAAHLVNGVHDGGAAHDAVGDLAHARHVLRLRDAKANCQRLVGLCSSVRARSSGGSANASSSGNASSSASTGRRQRDQHRASARAGQQRRQCEERCQRHSSLSAYRAMSGVS